MKFPCDSCGYSDDHDSATCGTCGGDVIRRAPRGVGKASLAFLRRMRDDGGAQIPRNSGNRMPTLLMRGLVKYDREKGAFVITSRGGQVLDNACVGLKRGV